MEEIKGEVQYVIYPQVFGFDDVEYTKLILKTYEGERVFCCGTSFPLKAKECVKMCGALTQKDGKKFMRFDTVVRDFSTPKSRKNFLEMICGPATAKKVIEYFGTEATALDIVKLEPQRLLEIKGIKQAKVERILKNLKKNTEIEEVYTQLSSFGFTLKDSLKIYRKLGKESINKVKANPYILIKQMHFGFEKCDNIAMRAGIPSNSLKRISAGIYAVLKEELLKGHSFTYKPEVIEKTKNLLLFADGVNSFIPKEEDIIPCYNKMVETGRLIEDEEKRVYIRHVFDEENVIREYVKFQESGILSFDLLHGSDVDSEIVNYETRNNIKLGNEQKMAVKNSLSNRLSIITGGPGTGKTTVLSTVIKLALEHGLCEEEIALCAPTGKAARRMMESINGALGTTMLPTTIHTLLEVDPTDENLESFVYNENNKLNYKLIVCDESSMIDLSVASSLIKALKNSTQMIFVGDIEQLPSVSYGNFLRDLIESNVPTVKLLEIHRQKGDSTIISLSQQIRDNEPIDISPKKDFGFLSFDSLNYSEQMTRIVDRFIAGVNKSNIDQTVVLTPINGKNGMQDLGTKNISTEIQNRINPLEQGQREIIINGWHFRYKSKVMITKNNNSLQLVNGQIGYITGIDFEDKKIFVCFKAFDEIDFSREHTEDVPTNDETKALTEELLESLVLGYAITIHKSQGSEWQNVIQICAKENIRMNTKALVYTGITRAKKLLIIMGSKETLLTCSNRTGEPRRSRILN